jgi:predicted dithiol-disulfide oxidoreductase (DUF899 family)
MTLEFPGESQEYREARDRLLAAEAELRGSIERVAAQRRALPPGGVVPEDYVFEEASEGGGEVRFSELFAPGRDTLAVYSFMFPRNPKDDRPGPAAGETAKLPLAETPCASCASFISSLDPIAPDLGRRINLAVVAKSAPDRIRAFAAKRGWRNLRLLSSAKNGYNRAYFGESDEGDQLPILNVFRRTGDEIRHFWGSEMMMGPSDPDQDPRHLDLVWPIWAVLDLTPEGRGTDWAFPALSYD